MTYTISLIDIINQIWLDGHEDEKYDTLLMPKWDNYLTKLDEKIDYAIPKIFSFDFPCYGDEEDKLHLQRHILLLQMQMVRVGQLVQLLLVLMRSLLV